LDFREKFGLFEIYYRFLGIIFGFSGKFWIFEKNLDFREKFGFLRKIWIFEKNLDF